jgi:hypothetical protein
MALRSAELSEEGGSTLSGITRRGMGLVMKASTPVQPER